MLCSEAILSSEVSVPGLNRQAYKGIQQFSALQKLYIQLKLIFLWFELFLPCSIVAGMHSW